MEVTRRGFIQGVGAACLLTVVKPDEVRKLLEEGPWKKDLDYVAGGSELWFPIEFDALNCEAISIAVNGTPLLEGVHYTTIRDGEILRVSITHYPDAALDAQDVFRVEVADLGGWGRRADAVARIECATPKQRKHRAQPKKSRKSLHRRRV